MKKLVTILAALLLTTAAFADNMEKNVIMINPLGGATQQADGVLLNAVGGVSSGQRVEISLPSGIDANSNTQLLIEISSSQAVNGAVMTQFLGGTSLNRSLSDLVNTYGNGMTVNWSSGAKTIIVYVTGITSGTDSVKIKSVTFMNGGVSYWRQAF